MSQSETGGSGHLSAPGLTAGDVVQVPDPHFEATDDGRVAAANTGYVETRHVLDRIADTAASSRITGRAVVEGVPLGRVPAGSTDGVEVPA